MVQFFLVFLVLFNYTSEIENLLGCASTFHKAGLFFCYYVFGLMFQPVQDYSKEYFAGVAYQTKRSVVITNFKVPFLW